MYEKCFCESHKQNWINNELSKIEDKIASDKIQIKKQAELENQNRKKPANYEMYCPLQGTTAGDIFIKKGSNIIHDSGNGEDRTLNIINNCSYANDTKAKKYQYYVQNNRDSCFLKCQAELSFD